MTDTPRSVLIVEDDPVTREMYGEFLQSIGFRTHAAEDGRLGFTMFRDLQPDLILLDVNMPEGGGVEMFRRVRNTFEGRDTPVLFVTGESLETHKKELMGKHSYVLQKPIARETLQKFIDKLFGAGG